MTCKDCIHYMACKTMLESQYYVVDGGGKNADKLCKEFQNKDNFVDVVRCKDCKYWQDNNGGYPHEECRWNKNETPNTDDYCSYGERIDKYDR